jgi:predicted RNA-binding protein YlxR (DUF448 family)
MATPIRTCVGCRTRCEQQTLQRFVRRDNGWTADGNGRSTGRGVYLCGTQCAGAVIKNKRFPGLGAYAITHYEHQDTHMND